MRPFVHLLINDIRVLYRTGYIWASIAVFALMLLVAVQASHLDFAGYERFVAAIILFDVVLSPVMLVGLLVLLERDEGGLAILSVSPAPQHAYIAARVLVVSLIALAEMFILVLAVYDGVLSPLQLASGLAAAACISALLGFLLVGFFDNLYAFMLPMIATILMLGAPGYGVLLGIDPAMLAWHPTAGALALIEGAFAGEANYRFAQPILTTLLWIVIGSVTAHWAVRRMQAQIGGAG
ncbi:MAG: hypothetical protein A4S17_00720 [Proteobacteria bacterium HN_bin10]|nr:MAG: hypothetical protein A4S17_00720 [Proteobacteria bacterium HN_bin10]